MQKQCTYTNAIWQRQRYIRQIATFEAYRSRNGTRRRTLIYPRSTEWYKNKIANLGGGASPQWVGGWRWVVGFGV